MTVKEMRKKIRSVTGWLSERTTEELMKHASRVKNGTILEIGTAFGKSAALLALSSPTSTIYTIEDYRFWFEKQKKEKGLKEKDFQAFQLSRAEITKKNFERMGVADRIVQIVADSRKYKWKHGEIDLLYIDGDHTYQGVRGDYLRFHKHVKDGWFIIFDDYDGEQFAVKKFVKSLMIPYAERGTCAIITKQSETEDLYFEKVNSKNICRLGHNGPYHPSQIEGLKLVDDGESMLDVGCGSATTLECLLIKFPEKKVRYKGVDFVNHRIEWCKNNFPEQKWEIQNAMKLKEEDNSWDVVWSRHVVDHLPNFEEAMDEQLRVAKKKVICVLWVGFSKGDDHKIKNVIHGGMVYKNEFVNAYNKELVIKYLESKKPEWNYNIQERIGPPKKERDIIIHLWKTKE